MQRPKKGTLFPHVAFSNAMPRLQLRHHDVPSLSGPLLVNANQQPRFWATVWAEILLGSVEEKTRASHLDAVEGLYRSVADIGEDKLDSMIQALDFKALDAALGGFLARLRNESVIRGVARDGTWKSARRFIDDIMSHLGRDSAHQMAEIKTHLLHLERLYGQISLTSSGSPAAIRALPSIVVEELHELFNPTSVRNPFRTDAQRWRNFLIFLILLHLGLRRGELLILPLDAVKDETDVLTGEVRSWIDVEETPYEDQDTRSSRPHIKTECSRRQLPVSRELVNLVDIYASNYRRRCRHPFLLNSQKGKALAPQTLAEIFVIIFEKLSEHSKKALLNHGKTGISPHDLRHTAATVRLAKYRSRGLDLDTAMERMRVFFGWAPESPMPKHYARAYFEPSLAQAWNETFDSYVDALRGLEGVDE